MTSWPLLHTLALLRSPGAASIFARLIGAVLGALLLQAVPFYRYGIIRRSAIQ